MIKEKIKKLINFVIDEKIKKTFVEIIELNIKYKLIWILTLPISFLFVIFNGFVIITSLFFYLLIFLIKLIKSRIIKKKVKNLVYKRRFKFLKNFYSICLEKILITFPKQKAFLIFYTITKSIYEKDGSLVKKEYLPEFIKSISNRIVIIILLSIPYIVIYCNTNLVKIIKDLKDFNYESNKAYINSIILNVFKDLSNDYSELITKLKIKFYRKKVIFNSKRDLIKALIYKKQFHKDFHNNKKYFKFLMIKHKIDNKNWTKSHLTAINNLKNEKSIYINETSKKDFSYFKYNKEINKYIIEKFENTYTHNGTINKKKITYYTPNIVTEKKNIEIVEDTNVNNLLKKLKEEKINNILIANSLNLDQEYLENKFLKINGIDKNIIIKNEIKRKTIEFYKENKDNIETEQYEAILGIKFFWEQNNSFIENLTINEKIELCQELKIDLTSSNKEINFNIFKEVMNKK